MSDPIFCSNPSGCTVVNVDLTGSVFSTDGSDPAPFDILGQYNMQTETFAANPIYFSCGGTTYSLSGTSPTSFSISGSDSCGLSFSGGIQIDGGDLAATEIGYVRGTMNPPSPSLAAPVSLPEPGVFVLMVFGLAIVGALRFSTRDSDA